jgi:hypothetical protein
MGNVEDEGNRLPGGLGDKKGGIELVSNDWPHQDEGSLDLRNGRSG